MRLLTSLSMASLLVALPLAARAEDTPPPAPATSPAPPAATPAAPATAPSAPSAAETPPEDEADERPKDRSAYISISPLHLILPVVEITAEIRASRRIGVAVIGGIGSIDPSRFSSTSGIQTSRFMVWEIGGQFVGYPVGHFDHGMQLGAELLYAGISGTASNANDSALATAQGLGMGPFIGYKYTAPVGFSLNIQGGVQYVTARADARSTTTSETAQASDSSVGPLLNLNVGWAF